MGPHGPPRRPPAAELSQNAPSGAVCLHPSAPGPAVRTGGHNTKLTAPHTVMAAPTAKRNLARPGR